MKKYLIIVFIIAGLGLLNNKQVEAQFNVGRIKNEINKLENKASKSAANQEKRLSKIKERADKLITNRINQLNRLLNRISNDKRLSAEEKTSLSSEIQAIINGLTTLKAKIDADTDVDTAKTDAKQIITKYYIYKIFVPKIRLLITITNLQTLSANIGQLTPEIQNLINTLKSQGKDVTSLESLLDDINSQLQTINTSLSDARSKVEAVSISTQDSASIFVGVRQDLANVRANFAKIRRDIGQMRVDFRTQIKINSPTPTPTL